MGLFASIFGVLLTAVLLTNIQGIQPRKGQQCGPEYCRAGRECITNKDGNLECACISLCPQKKNLVCGNDQRTYYNFCELHRIACVDGRKLSVAHAGHCTKSDHPGTIKDLKENQFIHPLVCYRVERDELHQMLVDSLLVESKDSGQPFSDILAKQFYVCDKNRDHELDSDELLLCLEKQRGYGKDREHLHRGLCVDALVDEGDQDADWVLDIAEFTRFLDPHFRPKTQECELEGKKYADGSKTKLDCNLCVCACGNWVCTGGECPDGKQNIARPDSHVVLGTLPTVEERLEFLRSFKGSEAVDLTEIQIKVADQYRQERAV